MRSAILPHPIRRLWWLELLLVDFRHAFGAWICYVAWVLLPSVFPSLVGLVSPLTFLHFFGLLAIPAMITTLIFGTDFTHATAQTLLTAPRDRRALWFLRTGLAVALFLFPLGIVAYRHYELVSLGIVDPFNPFFYDNVRKGAYMALCYGPLFAVLLRKSMLAWSATLVAPIVELMLCGLLLPEKFFEPFFWLFGIVIFVLAYRQWIRLEVRS